MFERFTNRARRVVVLAQEEARLLNHDYIGTEHLLLGLLADGEGVAARALDDLGIGLDAVRQQVEQIIGTGKKESRAGHIPFTPRAKKVLELSLREALRLGHNYIGTEHILLGLIREGHGVGAQILTRLGGDLSVVRMHVIRLAPGRPAVRPGESPEDVGMLEPVPATQLGIRALLADISDRLARIEAHLGIAGPAPAASGITGRQTRVAADTAPGEGGAAEGQGEGVADPAAGEEGTVDTKGEA